MRYAIIILVTFAVPALAHAATLKVPSQYPTIQDAIDAASGGDTVLVAPGTYVEHINFLGKSILVMSEQGSDLTIIEGYTSGICVVSFWSGEGFDTVLDGFTITNGDWSGIMCSDSTPTIRNNIITGNSATWVTGTDGGGICCINDSSPFITHNTIIDNWCNGIGGGISFSDCNSGHAPIITNNTIMGNRSKYGGGISVYNSNPIILGNVIAFNSVKILGGGYGGGIYCHSSGPTIMNNTISGNTANGGGGGIHSYDAYPTITGNIITQNTAKDSGGGISFGASFFDSFPNMTPSVPITSNIVTGNTAKSGGGISLYYPSTDISNNTIFGNIAHLNGGGIDITLFPPTVTNTILWANMPDQVSGGNPTVTYSNVQGGYSGTGNIDSDPLFVDPNNGDFHLTFNSPCRASGTNTAPGLTDYDFEGDPRIAYGTVDMGADEFYTHLYWTGDATPGGNVEVKFVGLPGTSPVGLCIGTGVLEPPIPSIWGVWYLQFPIIGPIDLGTINSPEGVLIIPGTIPGTPPPPYSLPMQALIGVELTNLSVLEVK
jgi:parallel beta-helix repeat protein